MTARRQSAPPAVPDVGDGHREQDMARFFQG